MVPKDHQHLRQQSRPQHAQPELDGEEACTRRRGRSDGGLATYHAVDRHTANQRSAVSCEPEYVFELRVVETVIAGQDDDELKNERFSADAADATDRRLPRVQLATVFSFIETVYTKD